MGNIELQIFSHGNITDILLVKATGTLFHLLRLDLIDFFSEKLIIGYNMNIIYLLISPQLNKYYTLTLSSRLSV